MIRRMLCVLMFVSFVMTAQAAVPVVPNSSIGYYHGKFPSWDERTHAGVDLLAPCGSGIFAFADGVVVDTISSAEDRNFNSLGYMVIVEQPGYFLGKMSYALYLHMESAPDVSIGQRVAGGKTIIGKVGMTGAKQGGTGVCHVHFEVRFFRSRFFSHPLWNNIYGTGDRSNSPEFLENWANPATLFTQFPFGLSVDKRLLRVRDQVDVFWSQNSKVYRVYSPAELTEMQNAGVPGWNWQSVEPLASLPPSTSGPIFVQKNGGSDGLLLRYQGSQDVFLINNNVGQHLSYEAFISSGYDWGDVIDVAPSILARFPSGSGATNTKQLFANQWTQVLNQLTGPVSAISVSTGSEIISISSALDRGWLWSRVFEWLGSEWQESDIRTIQLLPAHCYWFWAFTNLSLALSEVAHAPEDCITGTWQEFPGKQFTWEFRVEGGTLTIRRNDGFVTGTFHQSGDQWAGELAWGNGDKWPNVILTPTCTEVRTNKSWCYVR